MQTVLLVDDSKLLRFATERTLVKAGYRVVCAEDGEDALRRVYLDRPDLVLLDMMLPKMSGPDVLQALKADPATARIPVVVLTGLSQRNEGKLLKEGAAAFLEKGALVDRPAMLIEEVGRILRDVTKASPSPTVSLPAQHSLNQHP
ncbi:MAG TPA: response regulator [Verrucomicrobiae bacterium]|jgi:CheY-like chemotaxis protein|nr:response regulator [Verrucomicrobiae bacterium]